MEQHRFVDRGGRNLCDVCDKWRGNPEHVTTRRYDKGPRSKDYEAGYQAGYHAAMGRDQRKADR